MRDNIALTVASLLTILLMTIHLTQDIQNGASPRGMLNVVGIVMLAVWMYGTLMLAGRRSGYIIILLGSLLACYGAYLHFREWASHRPTMPTSSGRSSPSAPLRSFPSSPRRAACGVCERATIVSVTIHSARHTRADSTPSTA